MKSTEIHFWKLPLEPLLKIIQCDFFLRYPRSTKLICKLYIVEMVTMLAQGTRKLPKTRWIGVDVFKGWGVWYMFIIHAFIQQIAGYDASLFITTLGQIDSWWPYIFAVPIGIVSLWGFMFGLAFACTVAMQTLRILDKNPKKLLKYIWRKFIMGCVLLLLNKIGGSLFRISLFQDGSTLFPALRVNYDAQILDAIAWMGVMVPTLIWILYGLFRIKQTNHLVITLLVLLTFWFALTNPMLKYGELSILWLDSKNLQIISLFISKFVRGRFRLIPGFAYGFLGSIYAILLYRQVKFKEIISFALIFFVYCMVGFLIWIFWVDTTWFEKFANEEVPIPLTIVSMSTMQFLLVLFIRTHDYPKSEKKRVQASKRTTFWRRFSVFSLTGFSIGTPIADGIFSGFTYFWGPTIDYSGPIALFSWNLLQILTFVLFIWGFWEIILRLWENFEYKFSLDWFLAQIMAMLTGSKMGRSNVKLIIYAPNHYQVQEVIPVKGKTVVLY